MTIFGDGMQTRAFTCIDDVVPVMAEAIDTPAAWNQVFNVGAETPCTLNELARRVAAAMGVPPQVVRLPPRHEVRHVHASHAHLARVFGERPQASCSACTRRSSGRSCSTGTFARRCRTARSRISSARCWRLRRDPRADRGAGQQLGMGAAVCGAPPVHARGSHQPGCAGLSHAAALLSPAVGSPREADARGVDRVADPRRRRCAVVGRADRRTVPGQ